MLSSVALDELFMFRVSRKCDCIKGNTGFTGFESELILKTKGQNILACTQQQIELKKVDQDSE